jgi:redox-sensitive bicupin YhaK (pirin superfamily)
MLDDFRIQSPEDYLAGFPWHPHRGIETVTYMIEGSVDHEDSMGNAGRINGGDVQWMTAGSGIIHQEMPGSANGRMGGFQLWVNLPRSYKMMDPRYQEIKKDQIPVVSPQKNVSIRVICGSVAGISGPVQDIMADPRYLDITLGPATVFSLPVRTGHTAAAYIIGGDGTFGEDAGLHVKDRDMILFGDGSSIVAESYDKGMRFLFISAKPILEPVAWRGPIVMNTREELQQAFYEFEKGTFVKKKA